MAARTYENFDLLIEAEEAGSFRARVVGCPTGASPATKFHLPFDPTQLENLLLKIDPGRSGTRRASSDPRAEASLALGGRLFETVFSEDLMLSWSRSQDLAREHGHGLRLRLRLTDAPSIAGLPWELLYDRRSNSYIAQSERTPVVRYLEVPQPPRPLPVDGALKILVVISSPTDLPDLDVEAEWARVHDALAAKVEHGTVQIDRLPAPTVAALASWLRTHDVHILHFIGHGDYDEQIQDGVVYFCDRYGRGVKVPPGVLGPYLRDHDPLRLVLLNACQSARVDAVDPFSGMAQGLVQQDCTAVVAMQFPISDGAAVAFTAEFYGAIADGLPVDQAATSARKALLADYSTEWATPVLFLRSPDGQVFANIVAEPTTTTPVVTPVTPVATAAGPARTPVEAGPSTHGQPLPEPALMPEQRRSQPTYAAAPPPITRTPRAPVHTGPAPVAWTTPAPTPARQPVQPAYRAEQASQVYVPPPYVPPPYVPAGSSGPVAPQRFSAPPPHRARHLVAIIAVTLLVFVGGVVALGWYGSTLPDPTKNSPGGGGSGSGEAHGSGTTTRTTLTGPAVSAVHLEKAPTLDGDPSDWPDSAPTFTSDRLVAGAAATVKGVWGLGWTDADLYLIVDVTDSQVTQTHAGDTTQLFKGDGVSFEFGTALPTNHNGSLEHGDIHVMLGPNASPTLIGGINVAKGSVFAGGTKTIVGLDGVAVPTDHGYRIEAAIPWETLGFSPATAGAAIGMNLNVSDAVPSGSAKGDGLDMVSNNPARSGNDAKTRSTWGTLTLLG